VLREDQAGAASMELNWSPDHDGPRSAAPLQ
jgi:hypothetical protein